MEKKLSKLEQAKNLFIFVINSPDNINDVETFREDLTRCVDELDASERAALGSYILPMLLKDNGNLATILIQNLIQKRDELKSHA